MASQSDEQFHRAVLGFSETLRAMGIGIDQHRIQTAYRAIDALGGIAQRQNLYWAGRLAFCSTKSHLPKYDRAFEIWFNGLFAVRSELEVSSEEKLAAIPGDQRDLADLFGEDDELKKLPTSSEIERLRHADLAVLSPEMRAEVDSWIDLLRPVALSRRTRRFEGDRGSQIDRRRSVRRALRAGGEFAEIIMRKRRVAPRRVLFLIDVSGSMRAYANSYLRFAYATKRARSSTEVFTVGTRLTRVTRSLSGTNVTSAIDRALAEIPDWSGGTRLGLQFREFIREYGARGSARGAIVVIASDGWERGDVQPLGNAVAHLSRLAKRVVWVNPHLHRPGFAPTTAGMEVALPHVDRLVSGHSYSSLVDLCREIG